MSDCWDYLAGQDRLCKVNLDLLRNSFAKLVFHGSRLIFHSSMKYNFKSHLANHYFFFLKIFCCTMKISVRFSSEARESSHLEKMVLSIEIAKRGLVHFSVKSGTAEHEDPSRRQLWGEVKWISKDLVIDPSDSHCWSWDCLFLNRVLVHKYYIILLPDY